MEDKRSELTQVKQEVQKRYQADMIRYQRQIEKNKKVMKINKLP
jgi:hypothetical protein